MIKKSEHLILFLIFCCLNYFLYLLITTVPVDWLFQNKLILFFTLFIFIDILIFTIFFVGKQNSLIKLLNEKLKNSNQEIKNLGSSFNITLKKEIDKNIKKDRIIYEQSKLNSMNELITNIAHHWRQPLAEISAIVVTMQIKDKKELDINCIEENCALINENVQHLSNTIEIFNSFTKKIETKEVFRIGFLIDSLITLNNLQNINVECTIENDVSIYTYKNELFKALQNILKNSKEAFEENKIEKRGIYITVHSTEEEISIKISDTAGGIKKEIINKIFEPYFTTKHKSQDVGLGLYISYMIITDKIKGHMEVSNINNQKAKGTRFIITLPKSLI
jgi:signal transduction histidine kinase